MNVSKEDIQTKLSLLTT